MSYSHTGLCLLSLLPSKNRLTRTACSGHTLRHHCTIVSVVMEEEGGRGRRKRENRGGEGGWNVGGGRGRENGGDTCMRILQIAYCFVCSKLNLFYLGTLYNYMYKNLQ